MRWWPREAGPRPAGAVILLCWSILCTAVFSREPDPPPVAPKPRGVRLHSALHEAARLSTRFAVDREALLVEWLRELLYVSTSNAEGGAWAFVGAEFEELTETRLVGGVELARPPAGTEMERELKGVTYHDLEVGRRGGRWRARIVFDV